MPTRKRQLFDEKQRASKRDVQHCTGLTYRYCLNSLYNYLEPHASKMKYWKSTKSGTAKGKTRKLKNHQQN